MTFSLNILLYLYFAFLAVWAILSLIGFYHLVRFGGRMFGTFFIGFIYLIGTIIIIYLSYSYLSAIDWQTEVTIFGRLGSFNSLFNSPNVFR